ncbi:hypothetical protein ACFYKX_11640 [Cytobacillus sp. FJAT-54145]|uniref:Uncharacterized protein n=1 Tax=Cytobacillus spartinae TaxID=3299023 RepID=A0ABW6KAK4_9BACI
MQIQSTLAKAWSKALTLTTLSPRERLQEAGISIIFHTKEIQWKKEGFLVYLEVILTEIKSGDRWEVIQGGMGATLPEAYQEAVHLFFDLHLPTGTAPVVGVEPERETQEPEPKKWMTEPQRKWLLKLIDEFERMGVPPLFLKEKITDEVGIFASYEELTQTQASKAIDALKAWKHGGNKDLVEASVKYRFQKLEASAPTH